MGNHLELYLCLCWLVKASQGRLEPLLVGVVSVSLQEDRMSDILKSVIVWPLLKKPSLDADSKSAVVPCSQPPLLGEGH